MYTYTCARVQDIYVYMSVYIHAYIDYLPSPAPPRDDSFLSNGTRYTAVATWRVRSVYVCVYICMYAHIYVYMNTYRHTFTDTIN